MPPYTDTPTVPRPFDTAALPAFIDDLDPADLVLDEPNGICLPAEPPTVKNVSKPKVVAVAVGPSDRGRRG